MSDSEYYELASRAVVALESIAGSLIAIVQINRNLDEALKPHPLDQIPGLDDLGGDNFHINADGKYQVGDPPSTDSESEQVDAATLAREAEALLNAAATPNVKSAVEVSEGSPPQKQLVKINLFKQDRNHDIMDLLEACQDDPVLKQFAIKLREGHAPGSVVEIEGEAKVWAAAIELVYTYLPPEQWGSEEAAKAVQQFVAQHSDDA